MKATLKILSYLVFDGTSYYVTDVIEDDCEVIKKGYNFDALCEEADALNEEAY